MLAVNTSGAAMVMAKTDNALIHDWVIATLGGLARDAGYIQAGGIAGGFDGSSGATKEFVIVSAPDGHDLIGETVMDLAETGTTGPQAEAHLIVLASRMVRAFGLEAELRLSSVGDAADRDRFIAAWQGYLKQPGATALIPQSLDYLSEGSQRYFGETLEYLDGLGVRYELDPELGNEDQSALNAVFSLVVQSGNDTVIVIEGGGREPEAPSMEPSIRLKARASRIAVCLLTNDPLGRELALKRVVVASIGKPARLVAFGLVEALLDAGIPADAADSRDGIGAQLAAAECRLAEYAVIVGQKEVQDGTVLLRNLPTGAQEVIATDLLVTELAARLRLYKKESI